MKREKQLNFDIFDNTEEKFFDKNKTLLFLSAVVGPLVI